MDRIRPRCKAQTWKAKQHCSFDAEYLDASGCTILESRLKDHKDHVQSSVRPRVDAIVQARPTQQEPMTALLPHFQVVSNGGLA